MSNILESSKAYEKIDILSCPEIFDGYLGNNEIPIDILEKLSKELGFSYELYKTLSSMDKETALSMVKSMCKKNSREDLIFLVHTEEKVVLGYTTDSDRLPILNSEFVHRVKSLAETSDTLSVAEVNYTEQDNSSSILLKRNEPIVIEEKFEGKESNFVEYHIGVLIINEELGSASCRLVLYVNNHPVYLPSSYYNISTSRYKRSTSTSSEALEVLVLRIIDDLRDNALHNKIYDLHFRFRANKNILASYEEYNTILRTMRKIPTVIEDNSYLESLISQYEMFERRYMKIDDQKSSYLWRCTALADIAVGALVYLTCSILDDVKAPPVEYFEIRDLLGSYVSTNRIAAEIAREDTN